MKTHIVYIVYSITFSSDNPVFYEIRWKKVWNRTGHTDDNNLIIGRIRNACWLIKVRNTQSGYVILMAFPRKQWFHERASMFRYTYISCLCF